MKGYSLVLASIAVGSCATPPRDAAPNGIVRMNSFEQLVDTQPSFAVSAIPDAVGDVVDGLLLKDRIALLDDGKAQVRLYRWPNGEPISVVGGAGDDFGKFRHPYAAAALDQSSFVVLDAGRRQLSYPR
jgi:hypothetical protein